MNTKYAFPNSMTKAVTPLYEASTDSIPSVYYTAEVAAAIEYIVGVQNQEVAWLGIVEIVSDNAYLITDIYIPTQEVSAASVDINEKDMAELAERIMADGHDISMMRYHGHSHVNMGVSPSATDQEHLSDYLEHSDWFIREIRNKKGDKKVDIFDKTKSCVFQCVDTNIWELLQTEEFYTKWDKELNNVIRLTPKPVFNKNKEIVCTPNNVTDYESLLSDPFYVRDY